ncbi:hypothetical protein N9D31_00655 [Oligoflexaceae bacterium]|nr:hypothetical protein [Oligoflexaceae bacterium]
MVKSRYHKTVFLQVCLILLAAAPSAFAGSISSGGGGSVVLGSRTNPVALDFHTLSDQILDNETAPQGDLEPTHLHSLVGISPASDKEALDFAIAKVARWNAKHPSFVLLLSRILENSQFGYSTSLPLRSDKDAEKLSLSLAGQYKSVILFDNILGPVINLNAWNELNLESRAGLYIHEALRAFWNINESVFSEEQLRSITRDIIWENPRDEMSSLEQYFSDELVLALETYEAASSANLRDFFNILFMDQAQRLKSQAPNDPRALVAYNYCHAHTKNTNRLGSCARRISSVMCLYKNNTVARKLCLEDGQVLPHVFTRNIDDLIDFNRTLSKMARATGLKHRKTAVRSWKDLENFSEADAAQSDLSAISKIVSSYLKLKLEKQ